MLEVFTLYINYFRTKQVNLKSWKYVRVLVVMTMIDINALKSLIILCNKVNKQINIF